MYEKKLKDGIKKVVGKDGKVRYYDENGNEISEDQAFTKVKKSADQIKKEQQEREQGQRVDPKTGKKILVGKDGKDLGEEDEYYTDPKTGKKIKKTGNKIVEEEWEVDPKTGKKVKKNVE